MRGRNGRNEKKGENISMKRHMVQIAHSLLVLQSQHLACWLLVLQSQHLACWDCNASFRDAGQLPHHLKKYHTNHRTTAFTSCHMPRYIQMIFGLLHWFKDQLYLEDIKELTLFATERGCLVAKPTINPGVQACLAVVQSILDNKIVTLREMVQENTNLCTAILSCWESVTMMTRFCQESNLASLKKGLYECGPRGEAISKRTTEILLKKFPMLCADVHFHRQETLARFGKQSIIDLTRGTRMFTMYDTILDIAINLACFPERKDSEMGNWDNLPDDEWYKIGIHPKASVPDIDFGRLRALAEKPQ